MIIVEGPDGGGKTTLLNTISQKLGLPIQPRVVNSDTTTDIDMKAWVEETLNPDARGFEPRLFDRFRLISEPIYGPIMGREAQPGFNDHYWLTEQQRAFNRQMPVVIYCLPPYETVLQNVTGDPDNEAILPYIGGIYTAYVNKAANDIAHRSPLFTKVWDYTKWETEDAANNYIDWLLGGIRNVLNFPAN